MMTKRYHRMQKAQSIMFLKSLELIIADDNHDHRAVFIKITGIIIKALIMQPSYYQINIQMDTIALCSTS